MMHYSKLVAETLMICRYWKIKICYAGVPAETEYKQKKHLPEMDFKNLEFIS